MNQAQPAGEAFINAETGEPMAGQGATPAEPDFSAVAGIDESIVDIQTNPINNTGQLNQQQMPDTHQQPAAQKNASNGGSKNLFSET